MCLKPLLYLCFTPLNIPVLSIVNTLLHHVIVSSYREFYHDIIYIRSCLLPFTLGFNLPLLYSTILYNTYTLLYITTLLHLLYTTLLYYTTLHYTTILHYSHIVYNKTTLTYKGYSFYLYRILYTIVSPS